MTAVRTVRVSALRRGDILVGAGRGEIIRIDKWPDRDRICVDYDIDHPLHPGQTTAPWETFRTNETVKVYR